MSKYLGDMTYGEFMAARKAIRESIAADSETIQAVFRRAKEIILSSSARYFDSGREAEKTAEEAAVDVLLLFSTSIDLLPALNEKISVALKKLHGFQNSPNKKSAP